MQDHAAHIPGAESGFLPHGFCYLWDPELLWTHVVSDVLIGASYVVISLTLAWLVHRVRRDIPFSWVFVAFGLFIITCGLTHFVAVWTLWDPVYWLSAGMKIVTAAASVATAAAMPFTVPRAVATVREARLSRERELAAARAAALEEQNDELRRQAVELEAQRAEAEAARAAAEEADEAKTAFLRTMSHELRTPLNAIMGYEQLLESGVTGPVSEPQVEQLRRIHRSATHLSGLIDQVLTLSRGSAGERIDVEEVDPGEAARDVIAMLQPLADAGRLDLSASIDARAPISTDAGKLRQILVNLVGNALKFTDSGSVRIHVADDGAGVSFRVEDTGPGIAPQHLERVWEPFWQAQQGTTRAYGGTGLGLTVSRHLAELLEGRITLHSEQGRGTVATLWLPRRVD